MKVTINTIEELRRFRGISAGSLGMTKQNYYYLISGKIPLTDKSTQRICNALQVSRRDCTRLITTQVINYLRAYEGELTETQQSILDKFNF